MNEQDLLKALETVVNPEGACPAAEVLYDFVVGKLQGGAAEALRAHLIGCGACVQTWRDLKALGGIAAAETAPHNVVPLASKRPFRSGRALPALAAAASILAAASLGVNLLQWKGHKAPAGAEAPAPRTAPLLDLTPESLALRGGSAPALLLGETGGGPCVLVLNSAQALPGNVEIVLKDASGKALWTKAFAEAPLSPLTLVVPQDLLKPGRYAVEVRTIAPPGVLDSYPFQVKP